MAVEVDCIRHEIAFGLFGRGFPVRPRIYAHNTTNAGTTGEKCCVWQFWQPLMALKRSELIGNQSEQSIFSSFEDWNIDGGSLHASKAGYTLGIIYWVFTIKSKFKIFIITSGKILLVN